MTSGSQRRVLLYVDDFVAALIAAAGRIGLRGEIINVAAGEERTIAEVALWIAKQLSAESLLDMGVLPDPLLKMTNFVACNDRAAELLDWQPIATLKEGLSKTIDWYRDQALR